MAITPQIPFDFFLPEAPRFDNFVVGDNSEAVARLRALVEVTAKVPGGAGATSHPSTVVLWGARSVGKSHLLAATATGSADAALLLNAASAFPADPFITTRMLCVDNADQLNGDQQAWLFTAFNHVAQAGGVTIATGQAPPGRWPLRDDIRTRMGSGLAFELLPIPQDELSAALSAYALARGFDVSQEVLTFLLSHHRRDVASLCQTLAGADRLSLALKRRVTVPVLRSYLNEAGGTQ